MVGIPFSLISEAKLVADQADPRRSRRQQERIRGIVAGTRAAQLDLTEA